MCKYCDVPPPEDQEVEDITFRKIEWYSMWVTFALFTGYVVRHGNRWFIFVRLAWLFSYFCYVVWQERKEDDNV